MLKKISSTILSILFFLFLVMSTVILIVDYVDDYNLLEAEWTEAVIIDKVAEKGLFLPSAHFVDVDMNDNKYVNRISKKQMKELELGDKVSGFTTNGRDFSTVRDFLFDSTFYLISISLFAFLSFALGVSLLCKIKVVDEFLEQKLGHVTGNSLGKVVAALFIGILTYFSFLFIFNLSGKALPIFQTKTEAVIIDKSADITYKKYQDSTYEFTLFYDDPFGERLKVVKEVTSKTFNTYDYFDRIPISYRNSNPNDLFIKKTTFGDVAATILYTQFFLLVFFTGLLGYFVYLFFQKRRKKKK